jgi:hypothetical protein
MQFLYMLLKDVVSSFLGCALIPAEAVDCRGAAAPGGAPDSVSARRGRDQTMAEDCCSPRYLPHSMFKFSCLLMSQLSS